MGAEEALFETSFYRDCEGISGTERIPDRVSILCFRHWLEEHDLSPRILQVINAKLAAHGLMRKTGTAVDATLIAALSFIKNSTRTRDPEMHQVEQGSQWRFGMKAHIGVDAESGLVHTVMGTAANVNDVTQGQRARQGRTPVSGDQAPVRSRQGALPWTQEEHRAAHHAVCAVQSLDDQKQAVAEGAGMSASTNGQSAVHRDRIPSFKPIRRRTPHHARNLASMLGAAGVLNTIPSRADGF